MDSEMTPYGVKDGFVYTLHCLKMYNLVTPILLEMAMQRDKKIEILYEHRKQLGKKVGGLP